MFIDEARVYVKAGSGGDGCESFYRDKVVRRGGPDGGPGGDGGDCVIHADLNVQTLLDFQYRQHFVAQSGLHGSSNHKKGHRGQDLHIKVPAGTIIRDEGTRLVLRELVRPGDSVIIAKGGAGGRGNSRGRHALNGSPGEAKTILLELRLIADVGIIGYPNSGKSTLIARISSAHPKIAAYPFTTKEPVLGVVKLYDDAQFVVVEIPGLIEGAHLGRGLGHKFLRHAERTKVLIHLIDAAACDGRDPYLDYTALNKELESYGQGELAERPQVVALNKRDIPLAAENIKKFKKSRRRKDVFAISAATGDGIKELLSAVYKKLSHARA